MIDASPVLPGPTQSTQDHDEYRQTETLEDRPSVTPHQDRGENEREPGHAEEKAIRRTAETGEADPHAKRGGQP
jgi:hypothetical protein